MKILKTTMLIGITVAACSAHAEIQHGSVHKNVNFPEIADSYLQEVQLYELSNIANIEQGLNKDQVRHLLGNPQFNEGVFINNRWNYILDVHIPQTQKYQRCQLRIDFNQHKKVEIWHWKDSICADLVALNSDLGDLTQTHLHSALRSSNLQFAFNRFDRTAILNDKQSLYALIEQIKADQPQSIEVDGFADRLGRSTYNQGIATQRAHTVTQLLIEAGIDANIIDIKAHGSTSAYGQCDGVSTAQVVQCLTPNRRVNIYW